MSKRKSGSLLDGVDVQELVKRTNAAVKESQEKRRKEEEDRWKPKVVSRCRVCGGDVTMTTTRAYRGDPMHMIIGPGHEHQLTTTTHINCAACGIVYAFPPPPPEG